MVLKAERHPDRHDLKATVLPRPGDRVAVLCDRVKELWRRWKSLQHTEIGIHSSCRAILIRYFAASEDFEGWKPPKRVKDKANKMLRLVLRRTLPSLSKDDTIHYIAARQLLAPYLESVQPISKARAELEREIRQECLHLPCADWVQSTPGFSLDTLASIVGAAGDLSRFPTPGKLKVMMSIGFVDGDRQRKVANDSNKAKRMRFSPTRRSILFSLANAAQMNRIEPWRGVYESRKKKEEETRPEIPKGQRHNSALRVVASKMLVALWSQWRKERGMYHWGQRIDE